MYICIFAHSFWTDKNSWYKDLEVYILIMNSCQDGCVEVGIALQKLYDEDHCDERYDCIELYDYKCYKEIMKNDNYGHVNYAVMTYATKHGHFKCVKKLLENYAMYHADLSVVAAENGHYECLKYIMENCYNVRNTKRDFEHVTDENCKNYVEYVCKE